MPRFDEYKMKFRFISMVKLFGMNRRKHSNGQIMKLLLLKVDSSDQILTKYSCHYV